jgi:hypothetical protein
MVFITNNMDLAASSICDLYKSRWAIEVFLKELKQCLQLCDFVGYNERAVKWQIWTAFITYIILRYLAYLSHWQHSFTRLWPLIRGILWSRLDLLSLLQSYGTASGYYRALGQPGKLFSRDCNPLEWDSQADQLAQITRPCHKPEFARLVP